MITYVNSVFVSNSATTGLGTKANIEAGTLAKGQFVIMNCDKDAAANKLYITTPNDLTTINAIKIGMGTGKTVKDHNGNSYSEVRWSNIINKEDIKSYALLDYATAGATASEDSIEIDFTGIDSGVLSKLAEGGKRIIVRLTFKDLPTRFRKWTESYEYVTATGDDDASIAENIAALINKQWKRARVTADGTTTAGKLVLTAMPYDDDDSVNSLNWANKVRFNANIYYTDPAAEGWESLNKHFPTGVEITKTPGYRYPAEAKLVRDRENQAFGYLGILNRGCCTWPIVQPEMNTDLSAHYSAVTLEFENMYRAADDIFRKTKQTVEIYSSAADVTALDVVKAIEKFAAGSPIIDKVSEVINAE